jgi:hypothetical protein
MSKPATTSEKNISEALFEEYLNSQGLRFEYEKIYAGKSKRPDYTIPIEGRDFLFEVKQFEPGERLGSGGAFDPYPAIREKIGAARKKYKEFNGYPCCLVLYNSGAFIQLEKDFIMLGAMYGDSGFRMPFDPKSATFGRPEPAFLGRGKMRRKEGVFNTRFSAVITLRHYQLGKHKLRKWWKQVKQDMEAGLIQEEPEMPFEYGETQLGVVVWENVLADIPFPENVFCGPYDEHWGAKDGFLTLKFTGSGIIPA